jgi:hypothetical protein
MVGLRFCSITTMDWEEEEGAVETAADFSSLLTTSVISRSRRPVSSSIYIKSNQSIEVEAEPVLSSLLM